MYIVYIKYMQKHSVTFDHHTKVTWKNPINFVGPFDDLTFRITLECGRSMSGHLSTWVQVESYCWWKKSG